MMLFSFFHLLLSFQRDSNKILAKKLNVLVIVYLDDMFIYIDKTDHVDTV